MIRIGILFTFLLIFSSLSYPQCYKHKVNCSYGCGRHVDSNNDGYCDYTEFTADILQRLQEKVDSINNLSKPKPDTVVTIVEKNNDKCIDKQKAFKKSDVKNNNVDSINVKVETDSTEKSFLNQDTDKNPNVDKKSLNSSKPYDLILISLATILLYSITFLLANFSFIKKITHRKIWNILLLLTFLVSCLFGFFLVIQINYNFVMDWYSTVLYWHVQIGIAMTLISVFHIWWHLKYFKNIIKNLNN